MASSIQAIILAAGKSSRFKTDQSKVSYTICGKEMIRYPLDVIAELTSETLVVLGHQKDLIRKILSDNSYNVTCIEQAEQKGTGHAVLCTRSSWTGEHLLILNGDTPLLRQEHLKELIERHHTTKAGISCIASLNTDPTVTGYGRIIKRNGETLIIEQRDFTGDPREHCLLNAGVYLIERSFLETTLPSLAPHPSGELFITDLIKEASLQKKPIEVVEVPFEYTRGVNTLQELSLVERTVTMELIRSWMDKGVQFLAPESVLIDADVTIGPNTRIGFGVQLFKGSTIGAGVIIESFSSITRSSVANGASIYSHTIITDSQIGAEAQIGPFAHIHKMSQCHEKSSIGNFVEVSKSSVGVESKAKHLAYLGQAQIGKAVNIGAGTITCNYDGVSKHETRIDDNAFVGSNSALIAPVTIGKNATVAAGSTITENVPDDALGIARERQTIKEHYSLKIRGAQPVPTFEQARD